MRAACRRIADTVDPDGTDRAHTCDQSGRGPGGADVRRELFLSSTIDGLWDLRATLDAVTGERMRGLLDVLSTPDPADTPPDRKRSPAQRRHDALDTILRSAEEHPDLPSAHGARPHVLLTLDLATLLDGPDQASRSARLRSGIDIDVDRAVRLLSDAKTSAVAMWGPFRPVAFGRTRRVLPGWLRPVLHATHGTCRGPGCDRPAAWTQAAHVQAWGDGGDTDYDLTLPLCHAHHRLVDDSGWNVDLDPDTATATWSSPDGHTIIRTHPPPP